MDPHLDPRARPRMRRSAKIPPQPFPTQPTPEMPLQSSLDRAKPATSEEQRPEAEVQQERPVGMEGVYIISVAARILDVHPQTLRKYERLGLINPGRTIGMLRLYSREDILRVRLIQRLGDMGLNLAGVEFALSAAENLYRLNRRLQALTEDSRLRNTIELEVGALLRSLNLSVDD